MTTAYPPAHLVYKPRCHVVHNVLLGKTADTIASVSTRDALAAMLRLRIDEIVRVSAESQVVRLASVSPGWRPEERRDIKVEVERGIRRALNIRIEEWYVWQRHTQIPTSFGDEHTHVPPQDVARWLAAQGVDPARCPKLMALWVVAQCICCACTSTTVVVNLSLPEGWTGGKTQPLRTFLKTDAATNLFHGSTQAGRPGLFHSYSAMKDMSLEMLAHVTLVVVFEAIVASWRVILRRLVRTAARSPRDMLLAVTTNKSVREFADARLWDIHADDDDDAEDVEEEEGPLRTFSTMEEAIEAAAAMAGEEGAGFVAPEDHGAFTTWIARASFLK